MCDYSLQNIASRPAAVGDKLVTSRFSGAYSQGFASADEPKNEYGSATTAICVLPGTEIAFDEKIEAGWSGTVYDHKVGIFRQIDTHIPHTHHDALELPDGTHVKLHDLKNGLTATVLQLPAAPKTEAEVESQKRLEVVG